MSTPIKNVINITDFITFFIILLIKSKMSFEEIIFFLADTKDHLREHIDRGGWYDSYSNDITAWVRIHGGEGWGGVYRGFRCVLQTEKFSKGN